MFDLGKGTITFDRKPLPIKKWEVWFMCPFGVIDNLLEAIEKCLENDMMPERIIVPVPVAIDEAGRYEIIVRS